MKKLPQDFLDLLQETRICFVRVVVSSNLKRLIRDFPESTYIIENILQSECFINLSLYARKRNVISNAKVSLKELVSITIKEDMNKYLNDRLYKWS